MKTVLSAIVLVAVSSLSVAATTTAKVEQGLLKGTHEGELTVYKGVPFAAPPVGDLRWRPPQAAAKWQGVRPASVSGGHRFLPRHARQSRSEVCLLLLTGHIA